MQMQDMDRQNSMLLGSVQRARTGSVQYGARLPWGPNGTKQKYFSPSTVSAFKRTPMSTPDCPGAYI